MSAYADTSFLFSIYLPDANTPAARSYLGRHRAALAFTPLQQYELRNAVRLALFRQHADAGMVGTAWAQIAHHLAVGNLRDTTLAWTDVLHAADQLGETHTATLGTRALDLLHVGAAVTLGLKNFLTFDRRQRALAKAAGLRIGP